MLLRYVWQSHDLGSDPDDEDVYAGASAYWYEQRKAGNQLSSAANEWADAYERQLAAEKRQQDFLSAFADTTLAKPNAIEVIEQGAEPTFVVQPTLHICCSCLGVYQRRL